MTSVRKIISFAKESEFCSGAPSSSDNYWYAFPPGTYLSNTGARQAESIFATGSKTRITASYGYFSGQWNLSFIFDYNYLEPFEMVFESISSDKVTDTGEVFYELDSAIPTSGTKKLHYFKKKNDGRVDSFAIKMIILNEIAGGQTGSNEMTILKGCVAKSINVARSASGSQMSVEISGVYADQETTLGVTIGTTDYHTYSDTALSQYSCMFVEGMEDTNYVADVDSHSWSSDNNVNLVYNTCSPFASSYYEGNSNFSWNAQTYSNDPTKKFKLRPNSGGVNSTSLKPKGKGLAPLTRAWFATYSGSKRDDSYGSIKAAIKGSNNSIIFQMNDSTIKSMTWQKGDGSKMMDSLSSVECTNIIMRVVNSNDNIWLTDHRMGTSPTIVTHTFEYVAPTVEGQTYSGKTIDAVYNPANNLSLAEYKSYAVGTAPAAATLMSGWLVIPYNATDTCTDPQHTLQNVTPQSIMLTNATVTDTYTFTGDTGVKIQNVVADNTVKVNILATAPTYIGTDLYFVVKPKAVPETGNVQIDAVGLLRIDVE